MKIIVVDDELSKLETLTTDLEELMPTAEISVFRQVEPAMEAITREGIDLVILDIQLAGRTGGIGMCGQIKQTLPWCKVVFYTKHVEYAVDAFRVHADGFLCKPVAKEELRRELEFLFPEQKLSDVHKPFLHTFGNFDVFVDGLPVVFKRSKSKEALAWLTDRKGTWVTNQELMAAIWEDYSFETPPAKYASLLISDMITDLAHAGAEQIVERRRGRVRLRIEKVDCDYFAMLAGDTAVRNKFCDEYMTQYSWGEVTLSGLLRISRESYMQ